MLGRFPQEGITDAEADLRIVFTRVLITRTGLEATDGVVAKTGLIVNESFRITPSAINFNKHDGIHVGGNCIGVVGSHWVKDKVNFLVPVNIAW